MKNLFTFAFLILTTSLYSQKVSVKEINESRSTSDNSFRNRCEIKLKLTGDETRKYQFAKIASITKAIDDKGLDLLNDDSRKNHDYEKIDQSSELTFETQVPSRKADEIKEISGEITLYNPSKANGGEVTITNYQSKTNVNLLSKDSPVQVVFLTKESYEKYVKENKDKKEEELKKMPEAARTMIEGLVSAFSGLFSMDEDNANKALFYLNGDKSKFVDLHFEDTNGKRIDHNGKLTSGNLIIYYLPEKPNPNWKLIINVESPKSIRKLPFKVTNIELP